MDNWPALLRIVIITILAYEALVFVGLTLVAVFLETRGDQKRLRQVRELVVLLPSVFGDRIRFEWRQGLIWSYMQEGRYKDAEAQCRRVLTRKLKPAEEAKFRLLLADCLEGLVQTEEAEAEKRRAETVLAGAELDATFYLTRAGFLDKKHEYALACEAYGKALPLIPEWNTLLKAQALLQLGLASYNAGRPADAVRYAEEAIPLKPIQQMMIMAHSIAALGYSGIANLQAAEHHRRAGYELARESGNKHLSGELLAQLADIEMKHGKLDEAMLHCEQAAALHPTAARLGHVTRGECLRIAGRYDEAREAFEAARRSQPFPQPHLERRGQATIDLGSAWLEAEVGNAAPAMEFLEKAKPELAADDKLSLWCTATASWLHAELGHTEEARRCIWEVRTYAPAYSADRSTQSLCRAQVARACFHLGDLVQAREHWEAYFQTYPDPVFRPSALYHYGVCLYQMGEAHHAAVAWQQAVALNLPTYYSHRCRQRLQELEGATAVPPAS